MCVCVGVCVLVFYSPILKQTSIVLCALRHFNVQVLKQAAVKHTAVLVESAHTRARNTSIKYIIPTCGALKENKVENVRGGNKKRCTYKEIKSRNKKESFPARKVLQTEHEGLFQLAY